MAKRSENTFRHLSTTLKTLGFQSARHGDNVVFTHASGRPMILLPAYTSTQPVRPIHLMMVRKQLADVGMLEPWQDAFESTPEAGLSGNGR